MMGHSTLTTRGRTGQGGGTILVGDHIALLDNTSINAQGAMGGGHVLVGGDWQGGANAQRRVLADPNALHQATTVTMAQSASIDASATQNGDGGTVVLWSDIHRDGGSTNFAGLVEARGGIKAGNGGHVETSGHTLLIGATGRVNSTAVNGVTGDWLLDPIDFTIAAGTAAQTTSGIGADTLVSNLSSSNVTISTDASTAGNGDININASVVSSSANNLTLKAHRHINHKAGVTVSTAGGAVTYWADSDNNASGNINFLGAATINTGGGRLTMAGGADSGAGTPQGSAVQITTVAGNLSFNTAGGDVLLKASVASVPAGDPANAIEFLGGLSIDAGAGSITMEGVSSLTTQSNGISFRGVTTLASSKASGTAISITGNNAANSAAVLFATAGAGVPNLMIVKATGGGNINISNTGSGISNTQLWLENVQVLASTGDITINSNAGITISSKLNATTVFGKMSGQVDNSTSNITFNTRSITISPGNLSFDTSGQVTIQPFATSFSFMYCLSMLVILVRNASVQ
jgi:hypothetical protein